MPFPKAGIHRHPSEQKNHRALFFNTPLKRFSAVLPSLLMAIHSVYLCLGSNLGEKEANMEEAAMFILFNMGDIIARSSVYASAAWGMEQSPAFLNQVLLISTSLSPQELMHEIAELEDFFERERHPKKYLNRKMDVDILFYDDAIIEEEKIHIPHPRLHLRRFVLEPLSELSPELIHPVLKKNIAQLLCNCDDKSEVVKK